MYNLGEHFKFNIENIQPDSRCILKGNKYRITILSENLVRVEYNEMGAFFDGPSQLVVNRKFHLPNISVKQDDKYLEVKTDNFMLHYTKENPFKNNLKIDVDGKTWYFGHPEARRYEAPGSKINEHGIKSLYSLEGFVSIDDDSYELLENGEYKKREGTFIDKYIFLYGKNFNKCLKDYFSLTGYPTMIPRYALGIWWSKNKNYTTEEIKQLVVDFKDNHIPISTFLLDHSWHINVYDKKLIESGFTWNGTLIKKPDELTNYLHANGIRIGLVINPNIGFYPYEASYNEIIKYLQKDSNGIIPFNALDPKSIDVYLKILIHPLDNLGIDFYCNDTNKIDNNYWITRYANYVDMERNYQKRPIVLAKRTGLADHRYGIRLLCS